MSAKMARTEMEMKTITAKTPTDERGYMDVGGAVLPIHRIDMYEATSVLETGESYSLFPWGEDTDRIKGESTPSGRVLQLAMGVEAYCTKGGDLAFRVGSQAEIAEEMLDHRGYVIYPVFGQTRARQTEEIVEAAELLERLGEFWA